MTYNEELDARGGTDSDRPGRDQAQVSGATGDMHEKRVVLGRTGLEVCRLGFGSIPIQRVSDEQAVETVRHAIECGVDFIDTSRVYSTSERRIGLALKAAGVRADGRVSTGAGRVVLASRSFAKTADAMRSSLETSLAELDRDYIDIYEVHFVSTSAEYQTVIGPGGALEALIRARDEGMIGHIGLTSHNLEVLDRTLDDGLFDTIMVCFSFIEPQAREKIIPKALEKNIGVRAMKPFSGGVIDDAHLALQYAFAEPGIVVVAGVEHPDLFDQNWREFQEGAPLSETDWAQIAALQQSYDKVFCRRCDYCQPCSESIPIQTVLGVRQMVKRMGKQLLQDSQFWTAIQKGRDCTECGDCLPRCPYDLPIPELMKANLAWLDDVGA